MVRRTHPTKVSRLKWIPSCSKPANCFKRRYKNTENFPMKEWGLTDCASFVIMEENAITHALTTDHHFEQAGFVALMIEK